MKRTVLDASALMTFFEDRPGADKVEDLIRLGLEGKRQLLMSVANWAKCITPRGVRRDPASRGRFSMISHNCRWKSWTLISN